MKGLLPDKPGNRHATIISLTPCKVGKLHITPTQEQTDCRFDTCYENQIGILDRVCCTDGNIRNNRFSIMRYEPPPGDLSADNACKNPLSVKMRWSDTSFAAPVLEFEGVRYN